MFLKVRWPAHSAHGRCSFQSTFDTFILPYDSNISRSLKKKNHSFGRTPPQKRLEGHTTADLVSPREPGPTPAARLQTAAWETRETTADLRLSPAPTTSNSLQELKQHMSSINSSAKKPSNVMRFQGVLCKNALSHSLNLVLVSRSRIGSSLL